MAKITNAFNLSFSGKIGDIVGCNGKKGHYIRTAPKPSKKEPSPLQQATQKKMAMAAALLSPARYLLDETFTRLEKKFSSGYGAAISHLLQYGFTGEFPDLVIDHSKIILSSGNLPRSRPEIKTSDNCMVLIEWPVPDISYADSGNTAALIAYSQDRNDYLLMKNLATRGEGQAKIQIPDNFRNQQLHFYFFFQNLYTKKASASQYLGVYHIK